MSDKLFLRCRCNSYHFVEFWNDIDFGSYVVFVERPKSFREKLSSIFKILTNQDVWEGELIIKPKDYKKLSKYFAELSND